MGCAMTEAIRFDIKGLDVVLGRMAEVSHDMRRKGGRAALRKAAKVVEHNLKEGARALDDEATGRSIADNVVLRWNSRLFKRTGDLGFRVGIRQGAVLADGGDLAAGSATPHWRLLEFGTEHMPAQPFARRALADHIAAVTDTFVSQYDAALRRAIKRAARQAAKG